MIKTIEEILNSAKSIIGEDSNDDSLTFLEDITDTLNDLQTRSKDSTDWKAKCEETENTWRKKYRDRFFSSSTEDDNDDESDDSNSLTYESLFK